VAAQQLDGPGLARQVGGARFAGQRELADRLKQGRRGVRGPALAVAPGQLAGKPGKFFSAEQAVEHIGGYLVFNDITARDIQRREMKSGVFSFSKAIDTFCPIGPYILTSDEVGDPHDLAMELRVNGQVRQRSNTSRMSVSIPQLVAYHSPQVYSAGDLLTTGTIAGVAASTDDPFANYLKPGDGVEAQIEKLGILRNHVVSWRDAYGADAPPADSWI
jgi:2-keto-4-pentenoate hydratase/2-oxohepta-3-ene-1,7-dioic acid hydratase in catechol pathway